MWECTTFWQWDKNNYFFRWERCRTNGWNLCNHLGLWDKWHILRKTETKSKECMPFIILWICSIYVVPLERRQNKKNNFSVITVTLGFLPLTGKPNPTNLEVLYHLAHLKPQQQTLSVPSHMNTESFSFFALEQTKVLSASLGTKPLFIISFIYYNFKWQTIFFHRSLVSCIKLFWYLRPWKSFYIFSKEHKASNCHVYYLKSIWVDNIYTHV